MKPKVFISYSWSSESHRELVRNWADRLLTDGVQVVLDQYELKEGHDKYAFMEKMVTDPSVTHVLIISDRMYSEKADARKAGVGTESQIISQEVYEKVEQSKFIPIICELTMEGEPCLPRFIKTRIGINFSSPELVNDNWERLIRLLFGKPAFQKPDVGQPPAYILEDRPTPSNPALSRFASLKQALMQGKRGIAIYRNDFLATCLQYADALRIRQQPNLENWGKRLLEDCGKLMEVRDLIVDWVLLESSMQNNEQFEEALAYTLEKLLELRSRPKEVNSWDEMWFDAHRLFAYETFLYILAALLKTGAYNVLHAVYTSSYLMPEIESRGSAEPFENFGTFYVDSEALNNALAAKDQRLLSPAAALIKQQATRQDLTFESLMESDLLSLLAAAASEHSQWYPQTLFYLGFGKILPLFLRAVQSKNFKKIATITGVQTAQELRDKVKKGFARMGVDNWSNFRAYKHMSFWNVMNMDKMDTVK